LSIEISEAAGVRQLHFSSDWVQGAMRIARPWALELDYTREMMAALLLRAAPTWPKRALLIGLGAASLTKFLYRYRPDARLTVVEIDERVVFAARQHFKLPDDPMRIHIEIGDGADYVMEDVGPFDLILVDGFDGDARTGRLDSVPFYLNCRARLGDNGLLVANLLSRRRDYRNRLDRLHQAFALRALALPPCASGNVVAIAAVGNAVSTTLDELKAQAQALKRETSLDLAPLLLRLEQANTCRGGRLEL
jgi:spermidine synthase